MLLDWIILVLAIPSGYLIAWLARDELIAGRIWFKVLIGISLICAGVFLFFGKSYMALTVIFIAIVSGISLIKSYDKKWTRRRIS